MMDWANTWTSSVRPRGVRQTPRKLTLVVVVEIAQRGDARTRRTLRQSRIAEIVAPQVSEGLRAVLLSTRVDQRVERVGQVVVEGHRESLHGAPVADQSA